MWHGLLVSFDVFFQGFADGDARPGGGERMLAVLRPFIVREDPESSYRQIVYGNGEAEVYLRDDGMMANHVSGTEPWELLVQGARATTVPSSWLHVGVRGGWSSTLVGPLLVRRRVVRGAVQPSAEIG